MWRTSTRPRFPGPAFSNPFSPTLFYPFCVYWFVVVSIRCLSAKLTQILLLLCQLQRICWFWHNFFRWFCVKSFISSLSDTTFVSMTVIMPWLTQLSAKNLCQSPLKITFWHKPIIFCVNCFKKPTFDTSPSSFVSDTAKNLHLTQLRA